MRFNLLLQMIPAEQQYPIDIVLWDTYCCELHVLASAKSDKQSHNKFGHGNDGYSRVQLVAVRHNCLGRGMHVAEASDIKVNCCP